MAEQGKSLSRDYDKLLLTIRNKYNSMPPSLQKVADYFLESYEEAVYLNIKQVAERSGVSEATITKFVRAIEYKSFRDLKIALTSLAVKSEQNPALEQVGDIPLKSSIGNIAQSIFMQNIESLQDTSKLVDIKSLEAAVSKIVAARRIVIYGAGTSSVVATYAHLRFYRLEVISNVYTDAHQQMISAVLLGKDDVAIGISNSGCSETIVKALGCAQEAGATTVCITNYDNSPIVKVSDIVLFTASKDSQALNESLCARVAQISIVDILYASVVSKMKSTAIRDLEKTTEIIESQRLLRL